LKNIQSCIQSGAELTRQLLGFAGGGKYEPKPTNLNEIAKRATRMFGLTKKEVKIHTKYQKDIWTVEVDQGQIVQVLLNIYMNACQAMPGGGKLYLQTENVTLDEDYVEPSNVKPGKYVKISITDTGLGMEEATHERIFDPFFTTKEMGKGTGFGLPSAYGIIKNHGGIINVFSEKGEGTTFGIYLPALEKEVTKQQELPRKELKGEESVLLVDDENMIIDVGQEMLKALGHEVFTARSGREAIEVYEANKEKIDIVILDMIMPDMGGGEAFDRMKEISPNIKVLLSSGYSIDGQAKEILARGCLGFMQKPFNLRDLSQKLRGILDLDRSLI
jgi:CheY-like chemotaxis protein